MATVAAMNILRPGPQIAAVYSERTSAEPAAMQSGPAKEAAARLLAYLESQDRGAMLASLPFAMAEVAGHHGFEAAVALIMNFAGRRVYVAHKPEGTKLARAIGDDAARTLAKRYAGEHLLVPTAGMLKRITLNNRRDEAVMVRLLDGTSQEQAGFEFGLHRKTVQRIVRRYREAGDPRLAAFAENKRMAAARYEARNAEILRRVEAGESCEQIAADHGLARCTVRTIVSEKRPDLSYRGKIEARNNDIVARRRAGESPRDLAAAFELSPKRISAIIANHKRNGDGR